MYIIYICICIYVYIYIYIYIYIWRQHPTKQQLYGHLPPVTKTIKIRRTRHVEHCSRSRDEIVNDTLLWTLSQGRAKPGRPKAMDDREGWRERVRHIYAYSVT